MSGTSDFLDAESLRAATFVRHVELHDTMPSTSDRAIALAADSDLKTPALVVARLQTAGRGRGRHNWWSADGALTFSLILDTAGWRLTQRDWPRMSLMAAVAACDTLSTRIRPAALRIKWPNDVLFDGQKICGILIESPGGTAPANGRLIIGVGINVNNSWRDAPREAGPDGIALRDITGKQQDGQAILIAFLNALEQRLTQLAANDSALPQAWQQRCWLTEQEVVVTVGARSVEGRCLGIADDGALLVKTVFATERVYSGTLRVN